MAQDTAVLGGQYVRYSPLLMVNTHGTKISPALIHYLNREGSLLRLKHSAIGVKTPSNFYYKIDFLPSFESFQRYYKMKTGSDVSRGTLGVTRMTSWSSRLNPGDSYMEPQMPVQIICYWNQDQPWETFPTLIHEMAHAVHAADYGEMPLWLQEGLADWYATRKHLLGSEKKRKEIFSYIRHFSLVKRMDEKKFLLFLAAAKYSHWDQVFAQDGGSPTGYFLAQTLVDFFIGNPTAQQFFRDALAEAKSTTKWQFERSVVCAAYIEKNWPGGIATLLKGWKSWYFLQAIPKSTRSLEPFIEANKKHFHEIKRRIESAPNVTDQDRFNLVNSWLAFKRLETEDLQTKLRESYHRSENVLIRTKLWETESFAMKDHLQRWKAVTDGRKRMRQTDLNLRRRIDDTLYKKTYPYRSLASYLSLDPLASPHPRLAYSGQTKLPQPNQFWESLDSLQANMIFTNLFVHHLNRPVKIAKPKLSPPYAGPFTEAVAANMDTPENAVKKIGGKIIRDKDTGDVAKLDLSNTAITDDDLEYIAQLFNPWELDISNTDITGEGMKHLEGWSHLRSLKIEGTRLTLFNIRVLMTYSPGTEIQ